MGLPSGGTCTPAKPPRTRGYVGVDKRAVLFPQRDARAAPDHEVPRVALLRLRAGSGPQARICDAVQFVQAKPRLGGAGQHTSSAASSFRPMLQQSTISGAVGFSHAATPAQTCSEPHTKVSMCTPPPSRTSALCDLPPCCHCALRVDVARVNAHPLHGAQASGKPLARAGT